jgi:outer membrane lipoprotein-sorting protein
LYDAITCEHMPTITDRSMHPNLRFVLLALLLALAASPFAMAGPNEELQAAFVKFLAAKSFRATMVDAGRGQALGELEFVAPDRYRIRMAGDVPAQVVIGDTLYMDMGGRSMKLPVPAGEMTARYRDRSVLDRLRHDLEVTALGSERLDGELARVYRYTSTEDKRTTVKTWVSEASGMPLQFETGSEAGGGLQTVRVRYRDYGDPAIRIDPPG